MNIVNKPYYLNQIVEGTSTNIDAMPLFLFLKDVMNNSNKITLSFKNSTPMSSSFLNSSFGSIIDIYGFHTLKSHIKIIDCDTYASKTLKNYFTKYISLQT